MAYGCTPEIPSFPFEGVGYYRSGCATLSYPLTNILRLLPDELEPGPQTLTAPGIHPVLMLFGHHRNVHLGGLPLFELTYFETVLSIPFVQWKDNRRAYRGPLAYLRRMYLSELIPVLMGYPYAFPKELARIQGLPDYRVRTLVGDQPLLRGDFHPYGPSQDAMTFPNFADVVSMFQQPFVCNIGFGYVCSNMTFDVTKAAVRAADAHIVVEQAFVDGLITGPTSLPGLDTSPLGAFMFEAPWQITPPFGCGCLRCT
jgi:hypothetical protein